MQLQDKVALITGGKRIGVVVAGQLAARGVDVVLGYARSREEAEQAARSVRASAGAPRSCRRPLAAFRLRGARPRGGEKLGRIDVLLNMASVLQPAPFQRPDGSGLGRYDQRRLRGSFLCARAVVPHMRREGGGRIINFSDWTASSGVRGIEATCPYYVAKAGVMALTEALALELASDNILVNAIAPGRSSRPRP